MTAASPALPQLRSAVDAVAAWQAQGASPAAALAIVDQQVAALQALVETSQQWERLVSIARRTVDPWFATDWPDTFDPLMLVLPLCKTQDWNCGSCPIGIQQEGRACADPRVPVHRVGAAVAADRATTAGSELAVLRSMLRHAAE